MGLSPLASEAVIEMDGPSLVVNITDPVVIFFPVQPAPPSFQPFIEKVDGEMLEKVNKH